MVRRVGQGRIPENVGVGCPVGPDPFVGGMDGAIKAPADREDTVMAQYMLSVHHTADEAVPTQEEMERAYAQVDRFNAELQENQQWVFAGGLHTPDTATVVDGRGDQVITTDGPFAESKEHLGGFWIVEAADLDTAMDLARRGSIACGAPVEIRPLQGE